jgi:hypothetical protein
MKFTPKLFEGIYRSSTKAAKATRFTQMCVQYQFPMRYWLIPKRAKHWPAEA